MKHPKTVLLVKFRSALPIQEVRAIAVRRADEFRAPTGLLQKYYLEEPATGEIAGLYLWEGPGPLAEFHESALRASIAEAYQAVSEPRVEVFKVVMPLREDAPLATIA
jgi:hypothetical protein